MKRIIYGCLLAMLAVSFGCEKEEVLTGYENQEYNNYESKHIESIEEFEKGKFPQETNPVNTQAKSSKNGNGFGDSNGNIFDGGNTLDNPPNENYWTLLTEYPAGTTEIQKAQIRIPYQTSGQLLYFEKCLSDPNKELWYFYHNSVNNSNNGVPPLGNPKDDDPLFPDNIFPGNLMTFNLNQSCPN